MNKNVINVGIVSEKEYEEWIKENDDYIYRTVSTFKNKDETIRQVYTTTGEIIMFTVYSEELLEQTPF